MPIKSKPTPISWPALTRNGYGTGNRQPPGEISIPGASCAFFKSDKMPEMGKTDPGGKMVIVAEYPYPIGHADMKDPCKRITGIKFTRRKNMVVIKKGHRENGFRADLLGLNFIPDLSWYF